MAIAYPTGLGTVLASKSRTQVSQFSMSDPRRGPSYVQKIGTDTPVFWDVTFRFTKSDAQRFHMWFQSPAYLDRGLNDFTMDLNTEFGPVTHTCRFLDSDLLPQSSDGGVYTYTATITARKLIIPDEYLDNPSLIVELDNWAEYGNILDQVINIYWPH